MMYTYENTCFHMFAYDIHTAAAAIQIEVVDIRHNDIVSLGLQINR